MATNHDVWRLLARAEIVDLKAQYCLSFDQRAPDQFLEVFTENADLVYRGTSRSDPTEVRGKPAIRSFVEDAIESGRETAHMLFTPLLDVGRDSATGTWYYLVRIRSAIDEPRVEWGQGEYREQYRLVDGDWKIASLEAVRSVTTVQNDSTEPR